jgi:hypothetical protein
LVNGGGRLVPGQAAVYAPIAKRQKLGRLC